MIIPYYQLNPTVAAKQPKPQSNKKRKPVTGKAFEAVFKNPPLKNSPSNKPSLKATDLSTLQIKVLLAIKNAGKNGRTSDELENQLGLSHQTCSPRVSELVRRGLIKDSKLRRVTQAGRPATVWVTTAK